jgi:hypothetical protein
VLKENIMANLFSKLSGYKTYIVALGGAITALGAYLSGGISFVELVTALFNAAGVAGIRHGVSAAQK